MPRLTREVIRDRLRVKSLWITPQNTRVAFWVIGEEHMQAAANQLLQRYIRYVVSMLPQGNPGQADSVLMIEKLHSDGVTFTTKWSDIVVEAGVFPHQIPEGAHDLENPVISVSGGENLYGTVSGNSINLTVTYWDNDI